MVKKIRMRAAVRDEVPDIVAMLADDMLGRARESSPGRPPEEYWRAFDDIAADPNNDIYVALLSGGIVGCLQLTIIPGLSRGAAGRFYESLGFAASHKGYKLALD